MDFGHRSIEAYFSCILILNGIGIEDDLKDEIVEILINSNSNQL